MGIIFVATALLFVDILYFWLDLRRHLDYSYKRKKCTKKIKAEVVKFDAEEERTHRNEYTTWYIHTFKSDAYPGIVFYNKFARCYGYEDLADTVDIYINPDNPYEFYFPKEVKPRNIQIIVFFISICMMLLIIIVESHKML